ncbi:hypothetical protein A6770_39945 [Nostoc minutum NIES-26]|uniref:Uncharacterized protein n=1 Tax=Nostoc minutum NIES-26 TaxID=1844469 RepID=A0A367RQI8_9NOSO|nr:hypothetical protein A6770_39945 [Nostoc minutum NIES-26]
MEYYLRLGLACFYRFLIPQGGKSVMIDALSQEFSTFGTQKYCRYKTMLSKRFADSRLKTLDIQEKNNGITITIRNQLVTRNHRYGFR